MRDGSGSGKTDHFDRLARGVRVALLALGCIVALAGTLQAEQADVLDNGLVRLTFNQQTGQFEAQSLHSANVRLFDAGPLLEIDGKKISAHEAARITVSRQEVTTSLGHAQELVAQYAFPGSLPSFRYELALYDGKPWVSVIGQLPQGDYRVGDCSLVDGEVRVLSAFKTRVYVNSGTTGGDSGVWPVGLRQWDSAQLTVLYDPRVREAVGLGFYSFYRASTSVKVEYRDADDVGVEAVAHYYGYAPKTANLKTESLLLNFGSNPLKLLDDWADATVDTVHPKFNHDTRRGWLNTWYIYGDKSTAEDAVQQAKLLHQSVLPGYGITGVGLGEWQYQRPETGSIGDNYGFGENRVDPRLYPHGISWLADRIIALGLHPIFGGNYAYAAPHSQIAQAHEPWIDWDDSSRLDFGRPIDFTDPRAQQWLFNIAHRTTKYHAVEWWADFNGGPNRGTLHDPTQIMQFEDIRDGLKTIRRAIGSGVAIHQFCCGPYFPYVGLVDRVRVGIDAPALGDWAGFKDMARQLAANYMLDQRIWITDPDPLFVGGEYNRDMSSGPVGPDASLSREVRMRLQEQVISGGYVTIGENMADFTPKRMHLLTTVLPSYGQAARPLDMFVHPTPQLYGLDVKTSWDEWHVLLVQNWSRENQIYHIDFSRLGLDSNRNYLVFGFWRQHLIGQFRQNATLRVSAEQGRDFVIRLVPRHPWVLSTDMHLTQGGVELQGVRYDNSTHVLNGIATRNPGDTGHVVLYAPAGYQVQSASGTYKEEQLSSGAKVVHLAVIFKQKAAPWSITFRQAQPGGR